MNIAVWNFAGPKKRDILIFHDKSPSRCIIPIFIEENIRLAGYVG